MSTTATSLRCDPWGALLLRLVMSFGIGAYLLAQLAAWSPDLSTNQRVVILSNAALGAAVVGLGCWHLLAFLRSRVSLDPATREVIVRRGVFGARHSDEDEGGDGWRLRTRDIRAVVLARRSGRPLDWSRRIALQLTNGTSIPVGTIATMRGLLEEHALALAAMLGCGLDLRE